MNEIEIGLVISTTIAWIFCGLLFVLVWRLNHQLERLEGIVEFNSRMRHHMVSWIDSATEWMNCAKEEMDDMNSIMDIHTGQIEWNAKRCDRIEDGVRNAIRESQQTGVDTYDILSAFDDGLKAKGMEKEVKESA